MRKFSIILLALSFLFSGFLGNPDDKYKGVENIKSENLLKTVTYLASPELQGRLGGSEGYYKAAAYVAGEFKSLGLIPIGGEGYFQNFSIEYNDIIGPCGFKKVNDELLFKASLRYLTPSSPI